MSNIIATGIAFVNMGGYAGYVWSAYSIAFLVLLGNVWWTQHKRQKIQQYLIAWFNRQA